MPEALQRAGINDGNQVQQIPLDLVHLPRKDRPEQAREGPLPAPVRIVCLDVVGPQNVLVGADVNLHVLYIHFTQLHAMMVHPSPPRSGQYVLTLIPLFDLRHKFVLLHHLLPLGFFCGNYGQPAMLAHLAPKCQKICDVLLLEACFAQHVCDADLHGRVFVWRQLEEPVPLKASQQRRQHHKIYIDCAGGLVGGTSFLIVSTKEYSSKFCRSMSMPFTMRTLAPAV